MKWADYYDRFWDWAESTQISRISSLTDFTSSAQVAEIVPQFAEVTIASRLVRRAAQQGLHFQPQQILELAEYINQDTLHELVQDPYYRGHFTPAQILQLAEYVSEDVICALAKFRKDKCTAGEHTELGYYISDQSLLDQIAREDGINEYAQNNSGFNQVTASTRSGKIGGGLLAALFGFSEGLNHKKGHDGRCNGDCANCPDHYGYRYGRWYYGKHHSRGC